MRDRGKGWGDARRLIFRRGEFAVGVVHFAHYGGGGVVEDVEMLWHFWGFVGVLRGGADGVALNRGDERGFVLIRREEKGFVRRE